MSYDAWVVIAIVCFCIAAVCLVTAIIMFISFDIKNIRKELSGKQVENYMQEYRQKKEERKRVGIYDPSGRLIDVKDSRINANAVSASGRMNPAQAGNNQSLGDALARSRASAAVKSESSTQILSPNRNQRKDFVIIKDLVFTESSEFIG